MGERKVLNRYIPPDFDPSLLEHVKNKKRSPFMDIRMMLPFSLRCNTCGEYMYRGKKFNSKKEDLDENYMGIRKIRFYIKCTNCAAEIAFKTDPKNADYECESGALRNYELWRDNLKATEEEAKEREEEEAVDAMKALENRTIDNKNEMDVLDALDEIKALNQRHNRASTDKVLEIIQKKGTEATATDPAVLTAEDEALIKSIKFKSSSASSGVGVVEDDGASQVTSSAGMVSNLQRHITKIVENKSNISNTANIPVIIKKKRKIDEVVEKSEVEVEKPGDDSVKTAVETAKEEKKSAVIGLFADYGDDEDEEEE